MAMIFALLVTYNVHTLSEYIQTGLSIREWWNNQRMWRINTITSWTFGLLSLILKLLGLSEVKFEVTQKEQSSSSSGDDSDQSDAGKFAFDDSPYFVLGTTVLLVNLAAMAMGLMEIKRTWKEAEIGECICSSLVVLFFWPFFKGLFRKGRYGLPFSTICKSSAITLAFYHFSKWTSRS